MDTPIPLELQYYIMNNNCYIWCIDMQWESLSGQLSGTHKKNIPFSRWESIKITLILFEIAIHKTIVLL